MKIYIERRIESERDLPKEPGFYYIHYKHPNDMVHTQMSVVYYDETIKGLWFGKDWYDYWLESIEISDERAEKIKKWFRTYLSLQTIGEDEQGNDVLMSEDDRLIDTICDLNEKAMQEYAAIQVAKDRAEHLLLDIKTQPSDEDIEEWAREQFMPSKDYSHLTEIQEAILICFKAGCSYGAKSALSGQIKKKE